MSRWLMVALVALLAGDARADQPRVRPVRKPLCAKVIAGDIPRAELQVVGTVQQGKRRRLLLVDVRRNRKHIVMPGQCAARERVPFADWLRSPATDAPPSTDQA